MKVDDLLLFDFEANQIDEATQPDNSDANSNGNKKFMSKFSLILGIVFITGLIIVGYLNKDKLFNEKQQIKKDSEVVVEENGNDYSKLLNAGRNFSVYVDSIGTINGYGESTYKQLNFKGWSDIVQISAGGFHTVGLKSDGSVLATGFNDFGQINVSSWKEIKQISSGRYHTLGLTTTGTVLCVGENNYGQCDVDEWNDIIQVSAGRYNSYGQKVMEQS